MSSRLLQITAFVICLIGDNSPAKAADEPVGVKLTSYDLATYCDLTVDADGKLHAVFAERPNHTKAAYLYYRSSTDEGKTWSEAVNLSDDESGEDAGYARVFLDGKGRLYVAWKYVPKNVLLDGPGGHSPGRIVYRCLDRTAWSKRVPLGDAKIPSFSWFPAVDSSGVAHLVWSQMAKDAFTVQGWGASDYANVVRRVTLDGETVGMVKDVIAPKPLLTKDEQDKIKATGKSPPYEDTRPQQDGLRNLRGHITSDGTLRFVGEHPGIKNVPTPQQTGRRIVVWNGTTLSPVYAFDRFTTINSFNNPPALLIDKAGKPHLIRSPEKSEKACVRDYAMAGAELGDPVDVLRAKTGTGAILNWQAHQLTGDRMAVTAAITQTGGQNPEDTEIYVTYSEGDGKWSEPVSATTRTPKAPPPKDNTGPVVVVNQFFPRHSALAMGKDGKPCLLLVNSRSTLAGVNVRIGPDTVLGTIPRTENPAVFFLKY